MSPQLPQEMILKIFWNLSLRDCRSFLKATKPDKTNQRFNSITVEHALENRQSPILYLGHFFPHPSELLARMRMYNVWIIGSFALNYFSDHFQDNIPQIKFIIPHNLAMVINFMEYMRIVGVKWILPSEDPSVVFGLFQYHDLNSTIKLKITGFALDHMINCIRGQDLSILQCAITGYSAFHMYPNDVYDKQCSIWAFEHDCVFTYMPSEQMTKKYRDIGYKLIKGSRHLPNEETLRQVKVSRTIGDINSEVMTFLRLNAWSYDSAQDEKKALYEYRWDEYPSFLRHTSIQHDGTDLHLFILRSRMEEYFRRSSNSIQSDLIETFESACDNFEKSVFDGGKLSMSEKYAYQSIDEDYYAQFAVVSRLRSLSC
jgi:hypothetical protein